MAYLVRNLIDDAYKKSGILGQGMTLSANQLSDGVSELNLILDDIYTENSTQTTIFLPAIFTGVSDYTIGPASQSPDIVADPMPISIELIVHDFGGTRQECFSKDPLTFQLNKLEHDSGVIPEGFFYEKTQPLATIRFLNGQPNGAGTLNCKIALVDVDANTDIENFPREIRPYLRYELASKIAESNAFEFQSLKTQANLYKDKYRQSTYQGMEYRCDGSAPNQYQYRKYDIFGDR